MNTRLYVALAAALAGLGLLVVACGSDTKGSPTGTSSTGLGGTGGTKSQPGQLSGGQAGTGDSLGGQANGGGAALGQAGMGLSAGTSKNLLPPEGTGMTSEWVTKPYAFGPWFTYAFHSGATIVPLGAITTTGGKMCAQLAGTATANGGGAIGFQVCGAPKYPNLQGEYQWFPLNCLDNPAASCVPSEKAMPVSLCGGTIAGVKFVGTGVQKIEFKGPNDSNIGVSGHAEVVPVDGYAAAPDGQGANITAIHFKAFTDVEICLTSVELLYQ